MGVSFTVEKMTPAIPEVAKLVKGHWDEVALHKDKIKLDPAWHKYREIERLGLLRFYGVRDGAGKLVGYSIFSVVPLLHYQQTIAAANDVIFIHPSYRQGTVGIRFLDFCEAELKKDGVHKIVYHIKPLKDWSPILARKGYAQEEIVMGKYVGD